MRVRRVTALSEATIAASPHGGASCGPALIRPVSGHQTSDPDTKHPNGNQGDTPRNVWKTEVKVLWKTDNRVVESGGEGVLLNSVDIRALGWSQSQCLFSVAKSSVL